MSFRFDFTLSKLFDIIKAEIKFPLDIIEVLKTLNLTPKLYDKFSKFAEEHIACRECKRIELIYNNNGILRCSHCEEYNEFNNKQISDFLNYASDNSLLDLSNYK